MTDEPTADARTELTNADDVAALAEGDEVRVEYESKYAERGNEQELTGTVESARFTLTPEDDDGYVCASFDVNTDDGTRRVKVDASPEGTPSLTVKTPRKGHDTRTARGGLTSRTSHYTTISRATGGSIYAAEDEAATDGGQVETPDEGAVTVHHFDRDAYDGDDDPRFVADDLRRGEVEVTAERLDAWFTPAETVLGTTDLDDAYEAAQGHVVNREQGARHMVPSASAGDVLEVVHPNGSTEFHRVARIGFDALEFDDEGEDDEDDEDDGAAQGEAASTDGGRVMADGGDRVREALDTLREQGDDGQALHLAWSSGDLTDEELVRSARILEDGDRPDESRFEAGDRVVDGDDDEPATCRVLDVNLVPAGVVEVGSTGQAVSEFEGNEQYDDAARVVTVAFESALDDDVPEWDEWPAEELPERLDDYRDEWGVSVRTYDYPEPRLNHAPAADESDEDGAQGGDDEDEGDGTAEADGGTTRHMADLREGTYPEPDLPTAEEREDDEGETWNGAPADQPAPAEPTLREDEGDEWEPEPADLREGETTDDETHAERNAEMLRRADEELGDVDEEPETDGGRTNRTRAERIRARHELRVEVGLREVAPQGEGLPGFGGYSAMIDFTTGSVLLACGDDLGEWGRDVSAEAREVRA